MKGLAIIGGGGFGREAYLHALAQITNIGATREIRFFAEDAYATSDIHPLSSLDPCAWQTVIAIGDPKTRERIAELIPAGCEIGYIHHPSKQILCGAIRTGGGEIICAGAVITDNVRLGRHVIINLNVTIGHDCTIGDFVTIAPGANISGNVTIGNRCNIGTNAAIREKVTICDDVAIGMGSVILHDITEAGTYVGVPAKRVK